MTTFYRDYVIESIHEIENRCCDLFHCWYFNSAYRCRSFLRASGWTDVLTVCVGDTYLPMTRDLYREWRRFHRQLLALDAQ